MKDSEEFRGEYLHSKFSQPNTSINDGYKETFRDHVLSAGLQNNGGNMNPNNEQDKDELSFDDLDFTAAGYNNNKQGVEAASQHAGVFRDNTLQEHKEFWGVEGQQSRRFPEQNPAYDPQGRRIPDMPQGYDPQGRRIPSSHDRVFEEDSHTHGK